MRLLADENIPGEAVAALRAADHDVAWVRVDQPGSTDRDVLAHAQEEHRIVVTFDKDFGELAWRERAPAAWGVVLFRFAMPAPGEVGRVIAEIVNARADWAARKSSCGSTSSPASGTRSGRSPRSSGGTTPSARTRPWATGARPNGALNSSTKRLDSRGALRRPDRFLAGSAP